MSSGMAAGEMRSILVAIAIVPTGACDRSTAPGAPPPSGTLVADSATDTPATTSSSFTDRVWLRADAGSAPAAMQVYLSDGTLISDSCFETYRLSSWRLEGENSSGARTRMPAATIFVKAGTRSASGPGRAAPITIGAAPFPALLSGERTLRLRGVSGD